ncbi:hypothetical protein B0H16DRAFT_1461625 [Mycena metata]|uniref:Uncharacterized protein n=1 Tax=Mycena metata TaxID=1033252 RepID=A0AAD7N657_9AGAR|nr:hypothetical protein B0H16DRAFT_1461625 [Mycena metata]
MKTVGALGVALGILTLSSRGRQGFAMSRSGKRGRELTRFYKEELPTRFPATIGKSCWYLRRGERWRARERRDRHRDPRQRPRIMRRGRRRRAPRVWLRIPPALKRDEGRRAGEAEQSLREERGGAGVGLGLGIVVPLLRGIGRRGVEGVAVAGLGVGVRVGARILVLRGDGAVRMPMPMPTRRGVLVAVLRVCSTVRGLGGCVRVCPAAVSMVCVARREVHVDVALRARGDLVAAFLFLRALLLHIHVAGEAFEPRRRRAGDRGPVPRARLFVRARLGLGAFFVRACTCTRVRQRPEDEHVGAVPRHACPRPGGRRRRGDAPETLPGRGRAVGAGTGTGTGRVARQRGAAPPAARAASAALSGHPVVLLVGGEGTRADGVLPCAATAVEDEGREQDEEEEEGEEGAEEDGEEVVVWGEGEGEAEGEKDDDGEGEDGGEYGGEDGVGGAGGCAEDEADRVLEGLEEFDEDALEECDDDGRLDVWEVVVVDELCALLLLEGDCEELKEEGGKDEGSEWTVVLIGGEETVFEGGGLGGAGLWTGGSDDSKTVGYISGTRRVVSVRRSRRIAIAPVGGSLHSRRTSRGRLVDRDSTALLEVLVSPFERMTEENEGRRRKGAKKESEGMEGPGLHLVVGRQESAQETEVVAREIPRESRRTTSTKT